MLSEVLKLGMGIDNPLARYRQMVKKILSENLGTRIDNESDEHAVVLIDELIRHAKKTVKIYCRKFSSDIWGHPCVFDAVVSALEDAVTFHVLTQECPEESDTQHIISAVTGSGFRLYSGEIFEINFILVDDTAFRIEPNCDCRHGFAYAKNVELASLLAQSFDAMWYLGVNPTTSSIRKGL